MYIFFKLDCSSTVSVVNQGIKKVAIPNDIHQKLLTFSPSKSVLLFEIKVWKSYLL